jgi:bacterioferritin (cytochrome b1)
MDRAEAIKWFEEKINILNSPGMPLGVNSASAVADWLNTVERHTKMYGMAIAALREQNSTSRNELAELLEQAEGQVNNDLPSLEQMADYLIAHGVVIRRCK